MRSLILTSLYLFKDTVYRWKERPSSALSRLLVVFFLSLCALSFLSNYVLLTKSIQDDIRRNGGDLVVLTDFEKSDTLSKVNLIRNELSSLCDIKLIILNEFSVKGEIDKKKYAVAEYGYESLQGLAGFPLDEYPYLALLPSDSNIPEGPAILNIEGYAFTIVVRRISEEHMLSRAYNEGVILVPEGVSASMQGSGLTRRYIVKVEEMSYENVKLIDQTLRNICRLDQSAFYSVFSSEKLLARLSIMMNNQDECRTGFSIGIAVIVGILLTALASMEFRENEYVYTLMKSFGVRPFLLVLTFIMENIILVGAAFVASIFFFMEAQKIIMTEFFKLGNTVLTYADLKDDILLLAISLIVCVLVSSLPVAASAYREIGRILK